MIPPDGETWLRASHFLSHPDTGILAKRNGEIRMLSKPSPHSDVTKIKKLLSSGCLMLFLLLCFSGCRKSPVWQILPAETDTSAEITAPSVTKEPDPMESNPDGITIGFGTESGDDPDTVANESGIPEKHDTAPSETGKDSPDSTSESSAVRPGSDTKSPQPSETFPPTETEAETDRSGAETDDSETDDSFRPPHETTADDLSSAVPRYVYHTLSEPEQEQYDLILEALLSRKEACSFPTGSSKKEVALLVSAVLADYPEIFWTSGAGIYSVYPDGTIDFSFRYIFSEQEIEAYKAALSSVKDAFLKSLPKGASDYEKAMCVYEYLIRTTRYDTETYRKSQRQEELPPVSQTLCNALLDHYAVCTGYAKAAQYLLHAAGLDATFLTGTARGANHAWIIYRMNGRRYHMDACWGDPTDANGSDTGTINYLYFALSDEELSLTHSPDVLYTVPTCEGGSDTYFGQNGLYFESFDEDTFASAAAASISRRQDIFSVRFSADAAYREAISVLFTNGRLLPLLREKIKDGRLPEPQVAYSADDTYAVITLYFTYPVSAN